MSNFSTRRETCRLCGSRNRELVLPLAATPSGEDYVTAEQLNVKQELFRMDLFLCHDCGHAEFPDVINPDLLYRNYKYQTSISLGLVEHFGRYAEAVLGLVKPAHGSLVMDIGSNDGSLLKFFKARGHRVLGVDPATSIAQKATSEGVETLPTYFTAQRARELRADRGPAAVVTANNVFANIDDLSDFAAGIREMLAADGVFVFETSYLLDVLNKMLIETFFHEHLSYFSVKPLAAYFKRHGMELFDLQRVPTKGGSIRGFVQLAGGPRRVSAAVAEQVRLEEAGGLGSASVYRSCQHKMETLKTELHSTLADLRKQNQVIAGYGASVGVTTLLFQFDLGKQLDFLVDDNPVRHGLFSPGHHLPVLPSQALYDRKAGSVVVLAWAYLDPIRKRHQDFSKNGGRFVVPLPEVRVI
jgi:2-polyprenyl-3-methyl-5-hydroxy-6-metoxy-1,4-benzoquinol methylase